MSQILDTALDADRLRDCAAWDEHDRIADLQRQVAAGGCPVCGRDPKRVNNEASECSHVECPSRRSAWSERPTAAELHRGPWPKNVDADPLPLDQVIGGVQ